MAVRSRVVTVTTTATVLVPSLDQDSNTAYRDIAVTNGSAATVYLGGPDVTQANGFPLAPGAGISLDRVTGESLPYALVATGTASVAVLELGV